MTTTQPARRTRRMHYVTWERVAATLREAVKTHRQPLSFLAADLVKHLEAHGMVKKTESLEVYAREINEPVTLNLFFEAHVYGCKYERANTVAHALYFAPHLGGKVAHVNSPIRRGISYVARIESVDVGATWDDFVGIASQRRGRR